MGLRIREDYRNISGPEKSAILLMSLGEEQAGKLFALLDDEEIKEISQVMAFLCFTEFDVSITYCSDYLLIKILSILHFFKGVRSQIEDKS